MKQIFTFAFGFYILLATNLSAQSLEFIVQQQLEAFAPQSNLSPADISDWRITDHHVSQQSGIQHIYIRQQYQGIEIIGANADLHLTSKGKAAFSFHSKFISNIVSQVNNSNTSPQLSAIEAVESAASELGYRLSTPLSIIKTFDNIGQDILLSNGGISLEDIPAKIVYQTGQNGELKLAWDISILELNQQNWWSIRVDAATGKILDQNNWIVTCNWAPANHFSKKENNSNNSCKTHSPVEKSAITTMAGAYNVYALPIESPNHGSRTLVNNPDDATASPFGWHDTNGAVGAEFTITRGNNVHAQEDRNGNNGTGYSPNGGATLNFDYTIDLTQAPINNEDANITNLFYWNNIIHDVAYRYGFDEVSGNFQENNYGKGGAGSDYVFADAQDGSGSNNANFGTPSDGFNPRMQMFLWTAPNPDVDGDLDNGIILHEYGHGISNRLTGGRTTTSCLNNSEQMGEGWSDYFGMMLTMKTTDQGGDRRGVGTYALNQPTTGNGIRTFPYSTDIGINSHTYDNIKSISVPHGVGSVWCEMLWEMTWELIGEHGLSGDIYQGVGGNNIAMQLVMEGMKLQPCSPGFVDGRDAILDADTAFYNGANSCLIWRAFAKRGLGFSANQGSSNSVSDGTEAFDLPPGMNANCTNDPDYAIIIMPNRKAACAGEDFVFEVSVLAFNGYSGTVNLTATAFPTGTSSNITTNTFNTFPGTTNWTISNTGGLAGGEFSIEISGTDGSINHQKTATLEILPIAIAPVLSSPANNATLASLSQILEWNSATGASIYDLQLATDNAFTNIIANPTGLSNTSYATGLLTSNTTYYWRVRSNSCAISGYSSVFSFSLASACGQSFTDSGGSNGNYQDNELIEWVFCPDNAGDAIRVTFSSFNVERRTSTSCWDHLTVYNGNNSNAPSLGQFCGTTLAESPGGGAVTASNASGCLTFVFDSDISVTPAGWEATLSCICPEPIINDVIIANNCPGTSDGQIMITAASFGGAVEYVLSPPIGSAITNTTGIYSNLSVGIYSLIVRLQSDPRCATNPYAITLVAETPNIEDLTIIEESCENVEDASIAVTSAYNGTVEYILTPVGGSPINNTTGVFSNLSGGNYMVAVRKQGNASCVSVDSIITVNVQTTPPPNTTNYQICLTESIPNNEGLTADCGNEICNKITIQPNMIINASNTYVCDTIIVSGNTSTVSEIYLSLKITHTWVGDLSATLISPDGTVISLFDEPGIPSSTFGCSQNNLNLIFADTASRTAAELEGTCMTSTGTTTYAIEGAFQPINLFATLNGESANGKWKICLNDSYPSLDHGVVEEIILIINPGSTVTTWWDAPTGGNLLFTGSPFNPVADGGVDSSVAGNYSFWSACICAGCPSQRTQGDLVVSGNFNYYYADTDGDGFGDVNNKVFVCEGETPPTNYVSNFRDCNDGNAGDVNRVINSTIPSGMHQAISDITSSGTVFSDTSLVTFQAGDSIILKPGFTVELGGEFIAKIDNCGQQPAAPFKDQPLTERESFINNASPITRYSSSKISLKIYPNPFTNSTKIAFQIDQREKNHLGGL